MKNLSTRAAQIAAFATLLSLTACDFAGLNDSVDNFKLVVGLEEIQTPIAVKVMDASTGQLVDERVDLTFTGPDGDAIVDLFNDPIDRADFAGGVGTFGLSNDVRPSDDAPALIRVQASAPGYERATTLLRVAESGRQSFPLLMVRKGLLPEGAVTTEVTAGETNDAGVVIRPIEVVTPQAGDLGLAAAIAVRSGTVIRTADGEPLQGALTARINFFSAANPRSVSVFPGGFAPSEAENGSRILSTIGFVEIDIVDDYGREAHRF